jgi:hypothetical protein
LENLSTGQYIKHFPYRCGVITESKLDRTTIDFDTHGIEIFVTGLMVIELAEGTPPSAAVPSVPSPQSRPPR